MNLINLFKQHLESSKDTSSKSTVKNYLSDIRHFLGWFGKLRKREVAIEEVTPDVISLYEKALGGSFVNGLIEPGTQLSVSSMKRHLSSLRKLFTFLESYNTNVSNPFREIAPKIDETPTDYWHLKSFKDYLLASKASKITIKNYVSDIQGFARWYEEAVLPGLDKPLTSTGGFYIVTQSILEDYKNRLSTIQNAAPRTVNRKLSSLRRYIEFAKSKGFIRDQELVLDPVALYEQKVTSQNTPTITLEEISVESSKSLTYSKFPPFRLAQKLFIFPYLHAEEKAANIIAGIIAGKPISGLYSLPKKLAFQLSEKNALRTSTQVADSILSGSNIAKEFYAPEKVSLLGQPIHRKAIHHIRHTRPNWYKKYHNYQFVHYAHFALLVIFASGVGVALYNNLVTQNQRQASAAPTAPSRILSFQGRLTDNLDNPITTPTRLRFTIYNDSTASGSAEIWEEARTVSPDQDGIFSVLLGADEDGNEAPSCGSFPPGSPYNTECNIPSTVFSDNSDIWLGVTVASTSELLPRQKIATVGFATNAEFLQGLPPTTQAGITSFANVILALDSSGNLTLSDSSPTDHTFQVTNGSFILTGESLQLRTNIGSDGSLVLNPDGFGKIDFRKGIINDTNNGNILPGGVEIHDRFGVIATESAVAAFIVNNNTTGGDIFAASSSGTTRFVIQNDGSLIASLYNGQNAVLYGLESSGLISQAVTPTSGLCLQSGSSSPSWGNCGGDSFWSLNAGALSPIHNTVDLLIGGNTTASAKFRFINNLTGTPVASISANSGNNAAFLAGDGTLGTTNRQTLTIGNSSTFNTTGNILFNPNGVGSIGIGTTQPLAAFDLRGNSGTLPAASISAQTSHAALIVNNSGSGDLISASQGGLPVFRVKSNGDLILGSEGEGKITVGIIDPYLIQNQKTSGIQSLTFQTLGATGADYIFLNQSTELSRLTMAGQLQLPITGSAGGLVIGGDTQIYRGAADRLDVASGDSFNIVNGSLLTGGVARIDSSGNGTFNTLTVSSCSGCLSASNSPFQILDGAIVPLITTPDFLLGGTATASSKFAVLNMNTGTPTASISANSGNIATYIKGDGTIGTTNRQTLTIGNSSAYNMTGNVLINPNGTGNVGIGTTSPGAKLHVSGGNILLDNDSSLSWKDTTGTSQSILAFDSGNNTFLYGPRDNTSNIYLLTEEAGTKIRLAVMNNGRVGIGTITGGVSQFQVTRPADWGALGKALAIFDQIESQDILAASASGTTRFVINNNGNLQAGFGQTALSTITKSGSTARTYTLPDEAGTICLQGSGNCGFSSGTNWWTTSTDGKALTPINSTQDLLVGGNSTSSAKFAVLNNAGGTPTTSVSGNLIVMPNNGDGAKVGIGTESPYANLHILDPNNDTNLNIETQGSNKAANLNLYSTIGNYGQISHYFSGTKQWTLGNNGDTIGSFGIYNTSSNINRLMVLPSGNIGLGTISPISEFHVTRPLSFGATGKALAIFDQIENQDIFTASSSGTTRITIANNGDIAATGAISGLTGLTLASGGITLGGTAGTSVQCLLGGSSASWGSCSTGVNTSPFQFLQGAIVATNITADFLAGGQSSTSAVLKVTGQSNPFAGTQVGASISANTSYAGLVVDNRGVGDLLTASSSGVSQLVLTNNGSLGLGLLNGQRPTAKFDVNGMASISSQLSFRTGAGAIQTTAGNTLSIGGSTTGFIDIDSGSGQVRILDNTNIAGNLTGLTGLTLASGGITLGGSTGSGLCLVGGSTAAWGSCATGGTDSPFTQFNQAIVQNNTTLDFLLGGTATNSAKFAVLNIAGGTPTASISANSGNGATYVTGAGNLATTNRQTLTLGGTSTGEINIDSGTGTIYLSDNTTALSDLTINGNTTLGNNDTNDLLSASLLTADLGFGTTTGEAFKLEGNSLTTGEILQINSIHSPTDGSTNEAIDINITHSPTVVEDAFVGIDFTLTDNTVLDNLVVGIAGNINLAGDANKSGTAISGYISNSSALDGGIYGGQFTADQTGIITGDQQITGAQVNAESTGLNGGTINAYGLIATTDIQGDNGTMNATGVYSAVGAGLATSGTANLYGVRIAQNVGGTVGTKNRYGLYIDPQTDADNGYGICFDCDGTWSSSTVESGIQFGTDANGVNLYRSASDILRTDDALSINGNINLSSAGVISGVTGLTLASGPITLAASTGTGQCLIGGANASWGSCSTGGTDSPFQQLNQTIVQNNTTLDLLLGGTTTSSAKFGFLNTAGGTPTASISANSGNNSTFLTGGGNLGTTNGQTLSLGGSTTGNITLSPSGGSGYTYANGKLGIATTTTFDSSFEGFQQLGTGDLSVLARGDLRFNIDSNNNGSNALRVFANGNTTEVFRIQDDGSVGVGTTTPTALLDVAGTASVSGALKIYGTPSIQSTSRQSLSLGGDTTGNIRILNTAGSEMVRFDTVNSRVGIGTSAPSGALDVRGGTLCLSDGGNCADSAGDLAWDNSSGGVGFQMDFFNGQLYMGDTSGSSWNLVVNETSDLVGINTSTPGLALEVNSSNGNNLRLTYDDSDGSATNYTDLTLASDGDLTVNSSGNNITLSDALTFSNYTTNGGIFFANGSGVLSQTAAGSGAQCLLGGTTPTWGSCGSSGAAGTWTLDTSNKIHTPINNTVDLLVGGNSTTSAKFAVLNLAGGTAVATVSGNLVVMPNSGAGGFVGLGTISPTSRLSFGASTALSGGITFGSDANLYRSAANTLASTNNLLVGSATTAISTEGNIASSSAVNDSDPIYYIGTAKRGTDGYMRITYAINDEDLRYVQCTDVDCTTKNDTSIHYPAHVHTPYLHIGSDGFGRLLYFDYNYDTIEYRRCTNASCSTSNFTTINYSGADISDSDDDNPFALGSDGFGRIAITDDDTGNLTFIQCTNTDCTATASAVLDSSDFSSLGGPLIMASDGFARLIYTDQGTGDFNFVQCTNASCSTRNTTAITSGNFDEGWHLAMAPDGFARIVHFDSNGDLLYVQCTNASCSTSNTGTIDGSGDYSDFNALIFGTDGFARILYQNDTDLNLYYVQCTNADCSSQNVGTIDDSGNESWGYNMALDANGYAYITFLDGSNSYLKVTHCTSTDCSTKGPNKVINDASTNLNHNSVGTVNGDGGFRFIYFDNDNGSLHVGILSQALFSPDNNELYIAGDVGVNSNIFGDGNLFLAGNADIGGELALGGALTVDGATTFNDTLTVQGIATFNNTVTFNSSVSMNGSISTTTLTASAINLSGDFSQTAGGSLSTTGSYNTAGSAEDVFVVGNIAYVADGSSGLQVVDVSLPSSPTLTGTVDTSGSATGIYVSGKYAYVGDGTSGLQIIDVSNPASPIIVGTYNTPDVASGVFVAGKYAYVADGTTGLLVIDISNPSSPALAGSYNTTGNAYRVYISGKYAYVADGTSGLHILDISNSANPVYAGTYNSPGTAQDVYVVGKYAYVADGTSGMRIVNVSSAYDPSSVGVYSSGGDFKGVKVAGNYAYATTNNDGMYTFLITTPSSPSAANSGNYGDGNNLFINGKNVYLANGSSGLYLVDITTTTVPALYAGAITTTSLGVYESVDIGNNLNVKNAINIGVGGLFSSGAFSFVTASGSGNLIQGGPTGKALLTLNNTGTQDLFTASVSGVTRFTLRPSGNDIFAILDSGATARASQLRFARGTGNDTYIGPTSGNEFHLWSFENIPLLFANNNVERMRITNTGNVGIGTTSNPIANNVTAKLQVLQTSNHQPAASISALTSSDPALLVTHDAATSDLIVASRAGLMEFRVAYDGQIFAKGLTGTGGDFAEYFKKADINEQFTAGQLVCLSSTGVTRCTSSNSSQKLIGVVSDNALIIGGKGHKDDPNYVLVGMLGQLGVAVTGNVSAGDPLAYSSIPGVATVASNEGNIIGYAKEGNQSGQSRVSSVIQPTYFNPNTALQTESGIDALSLVLNNGIFSLTKPGGIDVFKFEAFSKAVIANLRAGAINAQTIAVSSLNATTAFIGNLSGSTLSFGQGTFASLQAGVSNLGSATASTLALTTDTITIGGQNIRDFIIDTVRNAGFTQEPTSPLATSDEVKTGVVSPLAENSTVQLNLNQNNIEVKNKTNGRTTAWFDNNGNASISGDLVARNIAAIDATFSGTLATNTVNSQTSNSQLLTTNEATVAGTLRADTIVANNITGLEDKISSIASNLIAQGSSNNPNVETVTAQFGIFEQGITAMGPITAPILTATDQLAVGGNFTISNNAINTIGADLEIQSFRQSKISFQGGLIKMDTDGNMEIAGNLNVFGEIDAVFGVFSGSLSTKALATSIISPLPGDDLIIKLPTDNASNSAKLKVTNSQNQEVLSINNRGDIISSGAATLSKLNFNLVGQAIATSLSEAYATGSAGFATLRSGQPEITIKNPNITSKSLIYITPFGDTNNKVLYLLRQTPQTEDEEGSFTIGLSGGTSTTNIQFNWLIVN